MSGDTEAQIRFRVHADDSGPVEPAGVEHIAIRAEDIEGTFDRLVEETGCSVVEEPETPGGGSRSSFVRDPDGYVVELLEFVD